MEDFIPKFEDAHFYAEQVIILRSEKGPYGKIVAHYPTAPNGDPDYEGSRPPLFTGHIDIVVTNQAGQSAPVGIGFPIETSSPIEAVKLFKSCAQKAVEDFQSQQFRQQIAVPQGVKTS